MENEVNKRTINKFKSLQGKYIKKVNTIEVKNEIEPFKQVKVTIESKKNKTNKTKKETSNRT